MSSIISGLIGWAGNKLPVASEAVLRIVGIRLLGKAMEIPEAWADGKVQAIRDKTALDSALRIVMGSHEIASAINDSTLVGYLTASILEEQNEKLGNKSTVFAKALEHLSQTSDPAKEQSFEVPSDDFLLRFGRFAEDAASDELRDALGKILAGEIRKKGTFSIPTLRVVSELDQRVATAFQEFYSEALTSDTVFRHPKYALSPYWDRVVLLRDAGLVSAQDGSFHMPPNNNVQGANGGYVWQLGSSPIFQIEYDKGSYSEVPIFNLTIVGNELGKLLPQPNFIENGRIMVENNPKRGGWIQVVVYEASKPTLLFARKPQS